ncbi:hypothetical protein ATK17_1806 [Branchiibius hedensis]|uniref:Uncharacterized protein n=1 Tax=Branchiibius hedensis TaxID=672460 RepID=A0A2Y9C1K4_9MICO|nr:hypothetical protein [Branchiibius hedensis]PWJ25670.1 hypothetical protein ATK17_1806 [Branchiibius hedensis]SSA34483.1 hypothetical protein SAMN04489750_1806 [Branchiibius hedensis]
MDSLLSDWLVSRGIDIETGFQPPLALLIEFAAECPQAPSTLLRSLAGWLPSTVATGWRPPPWLTGTGTVRQVRDQLIGLLAGAGMTRAQISALRNGDAVLVGSLWRAGALALEATTDPATCSCCALGRWVAVVDGYAETRSPDDAELALRRIDLPGQHACRFAAALAQWDRRRAPLLVGIDRRGYLSDGALSTRSVTEAISQARRRDGWVRTAPATGKDLPTQGSRRIPPDLGVWLDRLEEAVQVALEQSEQILTGD